MEEHETEIKKVRDWDTHWHTEIDKSKRVQRDYWSLCDRITDIIRDRKELVSDDELTGKFNILYTNHKLTCAAVYQNPPKPDIRRRFMDRDPAAKEAAEVLERALSYCLDDYDFSTPLKAAVADYDLFSRAVTRIIYEPEVKGGTIVKQKVKTRHIYRKDFLHEAVRSWDDVSWIAFGHDLSKERFDERNERGLEGISFTDTEDVQTGSYGTADLNPDPQFATTRAWEIWDKRRRKIIWFSESVSQIMSETDDVLELSGFWPIARPLFSNLTNDSLIPIPEYKVYQDLAAEMDLVTSRISALTKALKLKGLYAKENPEVERLLRAHHLEMIPVEDYYGLADKGGIEGALLFMPLGQIIEALNQLYVNRDQLKQTIFEITGLGDLLRGVSDPVESATAQRIKGQFGTLRLDEKRRAIERYARDLIEIKADLIVGHFEPHLIAQMANYSLDDPMTAERFGAALSVLKDRYAEFRIDVETDSTIAVNTEIEKEATKELLEGLVGLMTGLGPAVAAGQLDLTVLLELARVAIRPFRGARSLENLIDDIQGTAQNGAPQQPDPAQVLMQLETQKQHGQLQLAIQKNQSEMQKHQMEMIEKQEDFRAKLVEFEMRLAELRVKADVSGINFDEVSLRAQAEWERLQQQAAMTAAATPQPEMPVQPQPQSMAPVPPGVPPTTGMAPGQWPPQGPVGHAAAMTPAAPVSPVVPPLPPVPPAAPVPPSGGAGEGRTRGKHPLP